MKLKNTLIVAEDLERSKRFYRELFGLSVILDSDSKVILTEGLVLQKRTGWEEEVGRPVLWGHHGGELYFEEKEIEAFVKKLERYEPPVKYLTRLDEGDPARKMVRFYDPDQTVIEVGVPMQR